jgi:hypothetical protein
LTKVVDNKALEPRLRVLLRVILPLPTDDDKSTVADETEEESQEDKVLAHVFTLDTRLETLETKFDGMENKIHSLESKLDQILSLLAAVHITPAPASIAAPKLAATPAVDSGAPPEVDAEVSLNIPPAIEQVLKPVPPAPPVDYRVAMRLGAYKFMMLWINVVQMIVSEAPEKDLF